MNVGNPGWTCVSVPHCVKMSPNCLAMLCPSQYWWMRALNSVSKVLAVLSIWQTCRPMFLPCSPQEIANERFRWIHLPWRKQHMTTCGSKTTVPHCAQSICPFMAAHPGFGLSFSFPQLANTAKESRIEERIVGHTECDTNSPTLTNFTIVWETDDLDIKGEVGSFVYGIVI